MVLSGFQQHCSHIWAEKQKLGNLERLITVHRYLRAIGFSKVKKRDELQALINEVVEQTILDPDKLNKKGNGVKAQGYMSARDITADEEDCVYAELSLDFVHGAGICVRGEFDEDNSFLSAYYFP